MLVTATLLSSAGALPAQSSAASRGDPASALTCEEAGHRLATVGPNAMADMALHPLRPVDLLQRRSGRWQLRNALADSGSANSGARYPRVRQSGGHLCHPRPPASVRLASEPLAGHLIDR